MAKVKQIVNAHTSPTKNTAEIVFQVTGSTQNAVIDWEQRNYRGDQLSVFTGTGGTGTQLINGVDYSLVNLNKSLTSDADVNVYAGLNIINATYHNVDLYVPISTLDLYGDSLDESDMNRFQDQINLLPSGVETVIATDGQTINLTATKTIIYTDTTLSNVTITLGTAFDGARWIVISEGGNLTYVKGIGFHNTGTTGTPCNIKIKGDFYNGTYYPNNEIVSDYNVGSQNIRQYSSGKTIIQGSSSTSEVGSVAIIKTITLSISIVTLIYLNPSLSDSISGVVLYNYLAKGITSNTVQFGFFPSGAYSGILSFTYTVEGEY